MLGVADGCDDGMLLGSPVGFELGIKVGNDEGLLLGV